MSKYIAIFIKGDKLFMSNIGRPRQKNKYDLSGEFGIGYTTKGEEFYFDLEDYDIIKDYCWHFHKSHTKFYIEAKKRDVGSTKLVKMHRIVMNAQFGEIVDHVFRTRTWDNRKNNLRIVTDRENSFNAGERKNNTTGCRGVSYRSDSRKKPWRARIGKDYQEKTIGHFATFEEAVEARKKAEIEMYGEYARKEEL